MIPGLNFSVSYENTSEFFNGFNWKELGGIPNDYISFCYIEFGIIGVIIISLVLFKLFKTIDESYEKLNETKSKKLFGAALTVYAYSVISTADFESIIRSQFTFIILIICILSSIRKEEK